MTQTQFPIAEKHDYCFGPDRRFRQGEPVTLRLEGYEMPLMDFWYYVAADCDSRAEDDHCKRSTTGKICIFATEGDERKRKSEHFPEEKIEHYMRPFNERQRAAG